MTTNINWFPGHMARTLREMKEKLALVDLVIEVRDARAFNASTNFIIQDLFKNKPRIILLSKKDLADNKVTEQWIQSATDNPLVKIIAVNLLKERPGKKIINLINHLLKNKVAKQKLRGIVNWQIKIMIIGIPNVGKSRLINTLALRKTSNVANQPGVTKSMQWVKISNNIALLDTPGVLWPKLDQKEIALNLSLIGAIKEQLLPIPEISYYALQFLIENYLDILKTHYPIAFKAETNLTKETLNQYFLMMAKIYHLQGTKDEQIILAMEKFYFALKNGILKNISWEKP